MPNYNNAKIYKIWSPSHPEDIYIGSTTQSLAKRIGEHRGKYKQYKNGKTNYTTSFKILEYGDARIELIEHFECKCKEELTAREGHYIRTMDCVNKFIPGRTHKEYYQDNKDKRLQQKKQYRQKNKDKIRQRDKQHKSEKVTCDCGVSLNRSSLTRHKKGNRHLKALKAAKRFTT